MRALLPLLAAFLAFPAMAQVTVKPPPALEPVPEIPPPPGVVDDLEPKVTSKYKNKDRIEEFRLRGRLYMVKVTPVHGRSYYLIDQRGDGQMRRHDDLSPNFVVPLWMIKEF